jgi:hypothetical protein
MTHVELCGGRSPGIHPGWKWLYTRGYTLEAPATFALHWMIERAGPAVPRPAETRSDKLVYKVTTWEKVGTEGITFHDEVYRGSKLQLLGEERYRFLGSAKGGCIVEVVALRKPFSLSSHVGLLLFPRWSVRTVEEEASLFDEIDRDYLHGP